MARPRVSKWLLGQIMASIGFIIDHLGQRFCCHRIVRRLRPLLLANFGSYNKTYGSLGAIIGFMSWMWVSIIVVLVGAKLNAEPERRAAPTSPSTVDLRSN